MEDKPSGPGGQQEPPASTPATSPTGPTGEKYRGSRRAAERSRARYSDQKPKPPQGLKGGRKSRSWPTLVLLGFSVSVLALAVVVGLKVSGVMELSFLAGGGAAQTGPEPKPPAHEKTAQPQKADQKAAEPADGGSARKIEKAAQTEPPTAPDPLKTLIVLREKLMAGRHTAEERNSFLQGCLGLLASAVDYYGRGLSDQGNRILSDLDRNLSSDFIAKADLDGDLELSGVTTRMADPGQGNKYLVISGFVRNGPTAVRERVLLRAVLRDQDGVVIAKSFTLAGRTIPETEYSNPSARRFHVLLDTSPDQATLLKTTSSLPFLFVFTNPPASAKRYSVRIVLAPEKS